MTPNKKKTGMQETAIKHCFISFHFQFTKRKKKSDKCSDDYTKCLPISFFNSSWLLKFVVCVSITFFFLLLPIKSDYFYGVCLLTTSCIPIAFRLYNNINISVSTVDVFFLLFLFKAFVHLRLLFIIILGRRLSW